MADKDQQPVFLSDMSSRQVEVDVWFGVAAAAAQTFEKALALFTITMHLAESPGTLPSDLDKNSYRSLQKKTMGQILSKARQVVSFHESLDRRLQEAVNARNHLFHHFFYSSDSRTENDESCAELVNQLRKETRRFLDLAEALFDLTKPIMRALELSPSELDAELERWRHEQINL